MPEHSQEILVLGLSSFARNFSHQDTNQVQEGALLLLSIHRGLLNLQFATNPSTNTARILQWFKKARNDAQHAAFLTKISEHHHSFSLYPQWRKQFTPWVITALITTNLDVLLNCWSCSLSADRMMKLLVTFSSKYFTFMVLPIYKSQQSNSNLTPHQAGDFYTNLATLTGFPTKQWPGNVTQLQLLTQNSPGFSLLTVLQELIAEFYNHQSRLSSYPTLQLLVRLYPTPASRQSLSDRGLWNGLPQYSAVTHRCTFGGLFQHQPLNNFAPSTGSSCQCAESAMYQRVNRWRENDHLGN